MMLSQYNTVVHMVTEARDQKMGKFVLDLVCLIWGKIGQERPTLFDPCR